MIQTFAQLGLSENILTAIRKKGFEEPTEIQEKIIPLVLHTELDLIGQAQTGTGKTAAFALPMADKLSTGSKHTQAIILVPTRELAIQVAEEFNELKGNKNIHIIPIYGGQSYDIQLRHLKKGIDVVVGTPGRVIDHLNRGSLNLDAISFVVLDEADEMMNMGFLDDIEDILSKTGKNRRTLLFSATMPERIANLAKKFMKEREIIKTINSGQTTQLTSQTYYEVKEYDKLEVLSRIIDTTGDFYGLVFCRTKKDVDFLVHKLGDRGYDVEGLHGDITQKVRERILAKFKSRKLNVLVATDVAARGLDIDDLTSVINYSLPYDAESYLHRIGRTGRAGKEGAAITFVTPDEFRKLKYITTSTKTKIRKAKIPQINEVINFKKEKISAELAESLALGTGEDFNEIATTLMASFPPEQIVSALLKKLYGKDLEVKNYAEITDFEVDELDQPKSKKKKSRSRDDNNPVRRDRSRKREDRVVSGNSVRLFLAMGKQDGLTPVDILRLVENKAKVDGYRITGITINDAFSFFNASEQDAERIIQKLNPKGKGKRTLVERAKDRK